MNKRVNFFITLSLLAALSGCQGIPLIETINKSSLIKPLPPGPSMAPAPLPNYQPGEFFVFNNGRANTVTATQEDMIEWKRGKKGTYSSRTNFLIPHLSWNNSKYKSDGISTTPNNTLWPLKVGNKGIIEHRKKVTRLDGTYPRVVTRKWECAVDGTARVVVPAGRFDTFVITCKRYAHAKSGYELRASRRYYYAPAVGHYIIRDDEYLKKSSKRRELTAYGFSSKYLPKSDRVDLHAAIQMTLNRKPDGSVTQWRDQTGKVSATLTPVRSFKSASNQTCREYHRIYNISGKIRKSVKQACKDKHKGRWIRI